VFEVTCGPLGVIRFERMSPLAASTRRGLQVARWTGPGRRWASVTPVVLDRYPGRNGDLEAEVRRAVAHARLPDACEVTVSRDPLVNGSPRFTPADTLRRPGDRVIPYRHVVIDFDVPVRGPVVLGSMRHYGLGLCMPVKVEGEGTADVDA
jgi:CRISPR-associated protein Csb2